MLFLWFLFHIVAILMSFFVTVLFFLMWHMISFCQWMHNSQLGILTQYSENISHGSMGLQITGASQTGISTFTYLQYLCVYCHMCWCICQKKDLLFYFTCCCSLWPRTHDHKERVPPWTMTCNASALSTCCCWWENYCLCESIPKWPTAHMCVCILL